MIRKAPQQPPRPPSHLSSKTKKFWTWAVTTYELDPHHLMILGRLCEASDRCDEAREVLKRDGIVVKDRFGRSLPHPAVQIERDARVAVMRCVRELDLDATPAPESPRPPSLHRYQ